MQYRWDVPKYMMRVQAGQVRLHSRRDTRLTNQGEVKFVPSHAVLVLVPCAAGCRPTSPAPTAVCCSGGGCQLEASFT
jgi:hypothetical protein